MSNISAKKFPQKTAPQITICIPTYNRGKRLLEKVKGWKHLFNEEHPTLILDNCSNHYVEDYKEIEEIANVTDGLNYIRHNTNLLFEGNFLSMFRIVSTPFFLVVSDEDTPNFDVIRNLTKRLPDMGACGSLRSSMQPAEGVQRRQSCIFKDEFFVPGSEAIKSFGLIGNYVSGAIYNRSLLVSLGFDDLLEKNMHEHRTYPHLYMNILAAGITTTGFISDITCLEGEPEEIANHQTDYFGAYSYGQRIDQFVALRNAILEPFAMSDEGFDHEGFFSCYVVLCQKYIKLVSYINMLMYDAHAIEPKLLSNSFSFFCLSCATKMPGFDLHKKMLTEAVAKFELKYSAIYQSNKIERAEFAAQDKERLAELSASR